MNRESGIGGLCRERQSVGSATGNRQPDAEDFEYPPTDEEVGASGFGEKGSVNDYADLDVWKVGMSLATDCYRISASFPSDERFGLISQIRRAAVSIPANIAEGYGRQSTRSYVQFLRIAQGSTKELETLIELSLRLGYLKPADNDVLRVTIRRVAMMLNRLIAVIERSANR